MIPPLQPSASFHSPDGHRFLRVSTDAAGLRALVALEDPVTRVVAVHLLERDREGVESTGIAAGRRLGALALSPSGLSIAYELDGWLTSLRRGAQSRLRPPVEGTVALEWVGEERIVSAAALAWPPLWVHGPDGTPVAPIEVDLPDASRHQPALAVSQESRAIALAYEWNAAAVIPDVFRPEEHVSLAAASGTPSMILKLWFEEAGRRLVLAPWPDRDREQPLALVAGDVRADGILRPWLTVPCSASVTGGLTPGSVIAAPLGQPGEIWMFSPESDPLLVARLPDRVWGVTNVRGGLLAWTRGSVWWLDPVDGGWDEDPSPDRAPP